MNWHVDESAAARYAARDLDATSAASVESHVLACDRCRALVGAEVDDTLIDSVWLGLVDRLDQPAAGPIERLLRLAGCSEATARVVAATSQARRSFLLAVACSTLLALTAALSSDEQVFGMFLIVAPLGPLVATAGAFGQWSDPAYALATTSPMSALRLLLIRMVASVVPAIALTALSVPWVIDRGWLAFAWLLPSLALAAGALALSSWIDVERAAIGIGVAWLLPPLVLRLPVHRLLELLGTPTQLVSVLIFSVATGVVLTRRDKFEFREA